MPHVAKKCQLLALLPLAAWALVCCGPKHDQPTIPAVDFKAIVPKTFVVAPKDKAAEARFQAFAKLVRTLDRNDLSKVNMNWWHLQGAYQGRPTKSNVSLAEQQKLVEKIWRTHPHFLQDLNKILISGTLELPEIVDSRQASDMVVVSDMGRTLAYSAESYAAFGDFRSSAELIASSYRLVDRLFGGSRDFPDFYLAILEAGIITAFEDVLSKPGLSVSDCVNILDAAEPSHAGDKYAAVIQTGLLAHDLPDLIRESAWLAKLGSYDGVETIKTKIRLAEIALSYCNKPLSQVDNSYSERVNADANSLLKEVYKRDYRGPDETLNLMHGASQALREADPGKLPTQQSGPIRLELKRIHNAVGRLRLMEFYSYEILPPQICMYRALRDLDRILLASRIYRASHGGKLPESTAAFAPILGAWPTNPFDGKPYKYLPQRQLVYGVNKDFIDHDGDIGLGYPGGKDAGVSLKLKS